MASYSYNQMSGVPSQINQRMTLGTNFSAPLIYGQPVAFNQQSAPSQNYQRGAIYGNSITNTQPLIYGQPAPGVMSLGQQNPYTTIKAPQPTGISSPAPIYAAPSIYGQPTITTQVAPTAGSYERLYYDAKPPSTYSYTNTAISPGSVVPTQTPPMPLGGGQQAPATGLIGSEQAMTEGLGAITSGAGQARADITGVLNEFNDPNSFKNSAATEYLLGQSQKAIMQNAAARGGLGGGNVLKALQENAIGLASQDYTNQFSIKAGLADRLAGIAENAGIQTAGLKATIGAGRYQAGRDIAQNATQAASQISNLLNQQGANISDMTKNDITTITDMIYQSGLQNKIDAQQLATILANISGGQASQMSQGYQNLGAAQAAGIMGVGNAIQGGLGAGIATGLIGGSSVAPYSAPPARPTIGVGTGSQYGGYV